MEPTEIVAIAIACHQQNKAWCEAHGDNSQADWTDAPDWQRSSAVLGVKGVLNGNTPEQSHESWLETKVGDGWVFGKLKDADKKTHPCMVSYAELPDQQKAKDHLFVAMVNELRQLLEV